MNDSDLWADVGRRVAPALSSVDLPLSPLQQRRRRGFSIAMDDGREAVELVRDDGVLRWVFRPAVGRSPGGRRAWRSVGVDPRDVVHRFEFVPLGRNQITQALEDLDLRLNPDRGLRIWRDGWQPIGADVLGELKGKVLLLVHGTFSRSEMFNSELRATAAGAEFFEQITQGSRYAAVLSFDHATLSLAPWLNALALGKQLSPLNADLDIVCHSRGGLVVCWALRLGLARVSQVIFVGTPLMGTSLAAPNRLREALDLLANVADAISLLSKGAAIGFPPAFPLAMGAAGLARALGRVLNLGANLPLADALVGLVPGLLSQSRVENNEELKALFPLATSAGLAGIGVTFKPNEVAEPVWKFWTRFSHLAEQGKYYGAELIFRQPNDLVVDTASMNQLGDAAFITGADWLHLGESASTHHCSYFRSEEAIGFLAKRLL